jgi:phenylpyruvate tautomerase PptA (4-oxalocrotonate tautomerase family)
MPVYTCTVVAGTLGTQQKAELAAEMTRIHSAINHVPSTYVNVVFNELAADAVYTDGKPAQPVLVNGWVRSGHPREPTTALAIALAAAVTSVTGIPPDRVLVVLQNSPAHGAVEGGRVLPEPGQEEAWQADAQAGDQG